MVLEPIRYTRGSLQIINQLVIPAKTEYIDIENVEDGWIAIREMKTRGAPAIAITGRLQRFGTKNLQLKSQKLFCKERF